MASLSHPKNVTITFMDSTALLCLCFSDVVVTLVFGGRCEDSASF